MGEVLMVTRPVLPPWNEGSKNTAWQIAQRARRHRIHLMTSRSVDELPDIDSVVWEYAYSDQGFDTRQKLCLLWYLMRNRSSASLYHLLFVPTLATSRLLSWIVGMHHKQAVQTIPALSQPDVSKGTARSLFFADRVVAISAHTEALLRSLGVRNVMRINAGIDLEYFRPASNKEELRRLFGLPADAPVVLFSGELSRLGSVELFVSIVQRVFDRNRAIRFVFACPIRLPEDIPARARVREVIQDLGLAEIVCVVDKVADFAELLNACDMLLFPVSSMVGKIDTPLTVLEAMATELPVIITDLAPLNEVLWEEAGVAVPLGDVEAFAEAVVNLASDAELRRRMGRAGRRVIRKHYDVQAMTQAYERVYDQLV